MIFFPVMLLASLLLDGFVRPRRESIRHWRGILLHVLALTGTFGLFLAGSGNVAVGAVLAVALMALFTIASNAKYTMLGEPVVFSDLALLIAIFRHPSFYFTALSASQRWILIIGASGAFGALILLFASSPGAHLTGAGLTLFSTGALFLLLRSSVFVDIARAPDLVNDLTRYGLVATLLLYWLRWCETSDPAAFTVLHQTQSTQRLAQPHFVVIVQCESFSDPVEITGLPKDALPGLASARATAWQYGKLEVSGFGAYTMRTEYGVIFGRSEADLGFRRYDPFLTAHGETSHALAARLKSAGYHCSFVHPHDLRFYGRNRLMPAIGFDRMIGEEGFAPIPAGGGRYIDDQTLGAEVGALIDKAVEPTLIYVVTMENHGPWDTNNTNGPTDRLGAYLSHLRNSDVMLTELTQRLSHDGRPALLVFFGDHRPSIPGVTKPGGARHTPYVMLRFDGNGQALKSENRRVDLSPAELHHTILRCISS